VEYTTITISKNLKKQISMLKTLNEKETFQELLTEMVMHYKRAMGGEYIKK
jgi:hypothetical protein